MKAVGGDVGQGNKVTGRGTDSYCHCSLISMVFCKHLPALSEKHQGEPGK